MTCGHLEGVLVEAEVARVDDRALVRGLEGNGRSDAVRVCGCVLRSLVGQEALASL